MLLLANASAFSELVHARADSEHERHVIIERQSDQCCALHQKFDPVQVALTVFDPFGTSNHDDGAEVTPFRRASRTLLLRLAHAPT